jgi:DNA-directed RNA polymerase subunit N (RpoN/RPB10)
MGETAADNRYASIDGDDHWPDIVLGRIPVNTLAEAQEVLNELGTEALCIRRTTAPLIETVLGVVTQQDIDNYRNPGA